jgi:hypothetical protein
MFRQLAAVIGPNAVLTQYRPSQMAEYLETFWNTARLGVRQLALGPNIGVFHEAMARPDIIDPLPSAPPDPPPPPAPVGWHHLVYAYMLENTRVVDIFRRVILEAVTGERISIARPETQRWLHVTEQLFFASPWAYSVRSVTSSLRPDSGAVRRNAYYRLLGMDLNHGTDDGQVYPFIKADVANRDFATIFEALLFEVWRGYANRTTAVAENLTDDDAIVTLVRRLREMLQSRRNAGTLSREEFDAVAMLSWFHLTVETNTVVVQDLSATSEAVADRVMRIGERVGLPAHARSDAYLQLAVPMSNVLLAIESNAIAQASDLYAGFYMPDMLQIITQWSVATGRNIKDPASRAPIASVLRQLAPVRSAGPAPAAAGGGNGAGFGGRLGPLVR